jgi:ferritin-like metal-binding protein YciE
VPARTLLAANLHPDPEPREEQTMEATAPGHNRTGSGLNPGDTKLMLEAVRALSPPSPISTRQSETERLSYLSEADRIGSIPPPVSLTAGAMKKVEAKLKGLSPNIFLDKVGERIAFERAGTRLYEGVIAKYRALSNNGEEPLPPAATLTDGSQSPSGDGIRSAAGETALQTLQRIRSEELAHFRMLCEVATQLGADPTAQTPCADVIATASMGLLQVITDPRTTLAQTLNALLTAELTDNAGWKLLADLARQAGQDALAQQFSQALATEEQHQMIVTAWLKALIIDSAGTPAV